MCKNFKEKLNECRESIDRLDTVLIFTLGERFKQTNKIGKIKADNKLPTSDLNREKYQLKRIKKLSKEAKINSSFAEKLFKIIISEVKSNHEKIKAK